MEEFDQDFAGGESLTSVKCFVVDETAITGS